MINDKIKYQKTIKRQIMKTKINKYDISLIAFVIVLNLLLLFYSGKNVVQATTTKKIIVSAYNKIIGTYTVNEEYTKKFRIDSKTGYNTVHIENGEVWIHEASCPDQICVQQGKIKSDGEIIVCIPNQLIIEVKENKESDVDIIVK